MTSTTYDNLESLAKKAFFSDSNSKGFGSIKCLLIPTQNFFYREVFHENCSAKHDLEVLTFNDPKNYTEANLYMIPCAKLLNTLEHGKRIDLSQERPTHKGMDVVTHLQTYISELQGAFEELYVQSKNSFYKDPYISAVLEGIKKDQDFITTTETNLSRMRNAAERYNITELHDIVEKGMEDVVTHYNKFLCEMRGAIKGQDLGRVQKILKKRDDVVTRYDNFYSETENALKSFLGDMIKDDQDSITHLNTFLFAMRDDAQIYSVPELRDMVKKGMDVVTDFNNCISEIRDAIEAKGLDRAQQAVKKRDDFNERYNNYRSETNHILKKYGII